MVWPFKKRQPPRRTPGLPYVGGEAWALAPGSTTSIISPQAAEALAAVASCVSLISETIAALPCVVTLADSSRAPQPEHPLSRLVVEGCNDTESWSDLCASLVASALLRGNGLAEIGASDRGVLTSLTTIPFQHCTAWQLEDGTLAFDYLPLSPPRAGKKRRLLREEVVLLKARSDSGILGISPLQRSANAIQHALTTQTNSFKWMANASKPGGTLNSPTKVGDATMRRLSEDWDSNFTAGGERFGKTAVLPEGLEFKPLGWLTAEDAQIVERLSYTVRDISRVFNVPVFLIGDETRVAYNSATASLSFFAANTLRPWIVRLERSVQQSLLESRYRLQFDLAALLKADPDQFAAALLKLRQGGLITANEARAMLGLPPHGDGESLTPPSVISPGIPPANDGAAPKQWTNGHDLRSA